MKQTLILIRGLPGSGKSTLARRLRIANVVHFESDQFFIVDGEYVFDLSKLEENHRKCQEKTNLFLSNGFSVVVSNNFLQMWEIEKYLSIATLRNVPVQVVECKGDFGSVHNIPLEKIEEMRNRWEEYNGQ